MYFANNFEINILPLTVIFRIYSTLYINKIYQVLCKKCKHFKVFYYFLNINTVLDLAYIFYIKLDKSYTKLSFDQANRNCNSEDIAWIY